MSSIESETKAQFSKVFVPEDWELFKRMADYYFEEAVRLKAKNIPAPLDLKLLIRNSRKRLLIGMGVEFLLKSYYLSKRYFINRQLIGVDQPFPTTFNLELIKNFSATDTVKLSQLIDLLPKHAELSDKSAEIKGLQIAKVFRNKEGHIVTRSHHYEASNYADIEKSLILLYRDLFHEDLSLQFSVEKNELPIWFLANAP